MFPGPVVPSSRISQTRHPALYAFLDRHNVAYERCGKLVVATAADEVERVEAIFAQAQANEGEAVARLSQAQVHALEPELKAQMAVISPQSGVFDSHGYMLALQGEIEAGGGAVVLSTPFEGARGTPPTSRTSSIRSPVSAAPRNSGSCSSPHSTSTRGCRNSSAGRPPMPRPAARRGFSSR